jgi:hypothetical protein
MSTSLIVNKRSLPWFPERTKHEEEMKREVEQWVVKRERRTYGSKLRGRLKRIERERLEKED